MLGRWAEAETPTPSHLCFSCLLHKVPRASLPPQALYQTAGQGRGCQHLQVGATDWSPDNVLSQVLASGPTTQNREAPAKPLNAIMLTSCLSTLFTWDDNKESDSLNKTRVTPLGRGFMPRISRNKNLSLSPVI